MNTVIQQIKLPLLATVAVIALMLFLPIGVGIVLALIAGYAICSIIHWLFGI